MGDVTAYTLRNGKSSCSFWVAGHLITNEWSAFVGAVTHRDLVEENRLAETCTGFVNYFFFFVPKPSVSGEATKERLVGGCLW